MSHFCYRNGATLAPPGNGEQWQRCDIEHTITVKREFTKKEFYNNKK